MNRTLLERLRGAAGRSALPSAQSSADRDEAALQASICEHLRSLLNSHVDMAEASPDYGLPDVGEVMRQMPQSQSDITAVLVRCITKYEPRLCEVKVSRLDRPGEPLLIAFRIQARLNSGRSDREVWFDTVVATSGRVQVQPR